MRIRKSLSILLLSLLAATAQAASKQWVHLNVENANKKETVKMNIPISLVETMLPLIEEKCVARGKIRLEEKDIRISDLRNVWKEIRNEGDNEFLSVQNSETSVRVSIEGKTLLVRPQEHSKSQVDIRIPLVVVDAMLSGQGEELNLAAAVKALKESGVHDIITVKNQDTNLQIWIDESNKGR